MRVENLLDPVTDEVVDRLLVELAGDRLLDAVDQRELGVSLPGLVDEASVVERDAEAAGEGDEQPLVCLREGVLPVDVLERDNADRVTRSEQRHEQDRLRRFAGDQHLDAPPCGLAGDVLVDHQRLAGLEHVAVEPARRRFHVEPLAALDRVRGDEVPGCLVEHRDQDGLGVEDLLDLVADEVVDRLRVELAGDRRLDAVDQRELGVSLAGLVDEARVVERDAEAAGERDEQPLVGLGEGVLAVDVLERDDADRVAAGEQRHEQDRLRRFARSRTSMPLRAASPATSSLIISGSRGLEHVLA